MKRVPVLACALLLAVFAAGCGDDNPSSPSGTGPLFSTSLQPGNEVPAVTNADSSGSGNVSVALNVTRDSSNNVTSATGDFTVSLTGFPAGTTLTGAHIHPGRAGVNGGIVVNLGLGTGEFVLSNGAVNFTKTSINVPADVATNMLNDPAGYYFNVHTQVNLGGAVRGQLVRLQ